MHQQEIKNKPDYQLSGNNSQLKLADGSIYQLDIEAAFLNFGSHFPKHINLDEIHHELLGIQDVLTDHLPDDFNFSHYKSMRAQLNAYAAFFHALLQKQEGGKHE